jgi:alpha-amylase
MALRRVVPALLLATAMASCLAAPKPVQVLSAEPLSPPAAAIQPLSGLPAGTDGYPWWNDTVFYEVFVRSFYDSNADGIGDLPGLIDKLDYLQSLGVTGLWLMPIQPAASYHGYDVVDFPAVNPDYGTLSDMHRLLTSAHARGMRVIIDLVINHTSDQHPWFIAGLDPTSPYHGWYVWSSTDPDPNLWHPAPLPGRGFYYGYFGPSMPDLNYDNPAVTREMDDIALFWLEDVGVDGFRVDAAKYLIEQGAEIQNSQATHDWYRRYRLVYKQANPEALAVGEVNDISPTAASYAQGDQFDLAFDFSLARAILNSARAGRAEDALSTLVADTGRSFKPLQLATFLSNHDQNRVRSQLGGNFSKAQVAADLLLCSPGVPFIYYGEEIGMLGLKPDENIRTPMQWSAEANGGFTSATPWEQINPDYPQLNVMDQMGDPLSLLNHYRRLIRLRNQHAALRVGGFLPVEANEPALFAGLRVSQHEILLVAINLSSDPIQDATLSLNAGPLTGTYQALPLEDLTFQPPYLQANPQGGFKAYHLASSLPPFSLTVLQLQQLP